MERLKGQLISMHNELYGSEESEVLLKTDLELMLEIIGCLIDEIEELKKHSHSEKDLDQWNVY